MKSSGNLPVSEPPTRREIHLVLAFLTALVSVWACWTYQQGYLLYYGDAQAHLNNSRSIFDSRAPGYDQLGTVWLPVLHVICLPFVQSTRLWSSGLAGTFPVACCFIVTGVFLYLAVRHIHGQSIAAAVSLACFALNPNVLYLSVITMTEVVFLAGLAVLLYAGAKFQTENRLKYLIVGLVASWWMSLTRYDGWFLIPFAATWFAVTARDHRGRTFVLFSAVAGLAPLYWMAHSWWETANALDFYNGPYSAQAIQHGASYPGFHDWPNAFLYYGKAAQLCAGWSLAAIALIGVFFVRARDVLLPAILLLLPCVFYIWSIHSSGNPIFVPPLWPFTYYNSRYGIAFVFFAAFVAGALVRPLNRFRANLVWAIPLVALAPWLVHPSRQSWICWKESEVNSMARRAWTAEAKQFLQVNYREGQGILAPFGDVAGIICRSQIPLAQVLHEGGGPAWLATIKRPDLVHEQLWAIAQGGDVLDRCLSGQRRQVYTVVKRIQVPNAPVLKILRRNN